MHTLNYSIGESMMPVLQQRVCLSVTSHIVDLWQYYVCCIRSDVTQCLFMVLYLWQLSVGYTRCFARSTVNLCAYSPHNFEVQTTIIHNSVTLPNDFADLVFDGVGLAGFNSRANTMYFHTQLAPFLTTTVFPFSSFFLYVGIVWLRVFRLI